MAGVEHAGNGREKTMKGGCLCGAVRYETDETPMATAVCHCTHCQRASGSAFSVNVMLPYEKLTISGDVAVYEDQSENGQPVRRCFCPKCGSSLMSVLSSGLAAVKAGSLDDTSGVAPAVQVFTRSAQNWASSILDIPGFEAMI